MEITTTTYRTRSHMLPNIYLLVIIGTVAGMYGMFFAIFLGLGTVFSMAGLFIPMLLVFGIFSGESEYTLDATGLKRNLRPFITYKLFGSQKTSFYRWAQVFSYKTGTDMNRSMQQYEYLEIYLYGGITWQISNQMNNDAFLRFKEAFLAGVELHNQQKATANHTSAAPKQASTGQAVQDEKPTLPTSPVPHTIHRVKTFYETVWAKLFFGVMLVITICILSFLVLNPQYISLSNAFKILLVLLPGLGYMWWRLWGKKK